MSLLVGKFRRSSERRDSPVIHTHVDDGGPKFDRPLYNDSAIIPNRADSFSLVNSTVYKKCALWGTTRLEAAFQILTEHHQELT